MTSYVVYWTFDLHLRGITACRKDFKNFEDMLKYAERLRSRRKSGASYSHIVTSIEDDNMVGEFGVEAPPSDYDWKKRRP